MDSKTTQAELTRLSLSLDLKDSQVRGDNEDSIESRLIERLTSLLGLKQAGRFNQNAKSLELLLESSGLHHRRSTISIHGNSSQPPVVFVPEGLTSPSIIYSSKGMRYIYSPESDTTCALKDGSIVPEEGYEIYAGLPSDMQSMWSLYAFLLPVIAQDTVIAIVLALFLALIELATPWLTSQVVGNVVPSGSLSLLLNAFIVGLLITLFSSAFTWTQATYLSRIQHSVSQRLQVAVYDRVMKLPLEFINKYSTGDFASRISGLQQVARSLSGSPLAALISSLSLVGYAFLMLYYDATLAGWSIALVVVGGVIQYFMARRQIRLQSDIEKSEADVYQSSLQIISSVPQIRSNASEALALKSWFNSLIYTTSKQYLKSSAEALSELVSEVVSSGGKTVLFAVVVIRMIRADNLMDSLIAASTFIIFSATYDSMSNKFVEVVSVVNDLIGSTYTLWQRAVPIITHEPESGYTKTSPIYKNDFLASVDLNSISFCYPGSPNPVFDNLTCSFKYGKFNAVFGPSGCGKTTLFNLILRFYEPGNGLITIDGCPVDDIFIKDYRRLFGVVLQKPTLPAGSIRDAISSGLDYGDEKIWQALEFANAAEEIGNMPMGLETMLSEGAQNISGGQRQRLAIARAIIRRPRILLEDEATSALDATSQSIISQNLAEAGITRIVVAHRLSAISNCDNIVVLNSGRVEAEGSFETVSVKSAYLAKVLREATD